MGGTGSGRSGGRPTISRTRSYVLSITKLREALKLGGVRFTMTYSSDWDEIEVVGEVETDGPAPHITLFHPRRRDDYSDHSYRVSLTRTYPHLGGVRWWFVCPSRGLRVAKLYLPIGGRRFLSRQSYRLVHNTRQMSTVHRQSYRVGKIAARLGSPDNGCIEPPDKPARMRWRTYDRLIELWYRARDRYWDTLDGRTAMSRWMPAAE